jgi:hypothetical protein
MWERPRPVIQTLSGPAPHQGPQDMPDTTATDWPDRVAYVLTAIPAPGQLPGFTLDTLLPTPDVFDEPIQSLEQAAATFDVMGGDLGGTLAEVRWQGNDATRFRQQFDGTRTPQLTARAGDLRDLARQLQRVQARTRDEIDWIRLISREAVDFLDRVELAFQSARNMAMDALGDARRAWDSAHDTLTQAAGGAVDLARAGLDQLTGGDGLDDLVRAARHAQDAVGNAQQALDAVVDFTLNWRFNRLNLPHGVCRAWYDVDDFMATMSGSGEAYGTTYAARGPFRA